VEREYFVYILASRSRVLYVGVTNDLERRLFEHKRKLIKGFTCKYDVDRLVYFESTPDVFAAITREKEIKGWRRSRKAALIESSNPHWMDLSLDWADKEEIPRRFAPRNDNA
jgi:putative endonuclease